MTVHFTVQTLSVATPVALVIGPDSVGTAFDPDPVGVAAIVVVAARLGSLKMLR